MGEQFSKKMKYGVLLTVVALKWLLFPKKYLGDYCDDDFIIAAFSAICWFYERVLTPVCILCVFALLHL